MTARPRQPSPQATDNTEKFARGGLEGWLIERFRRGLVSMASDARPVTLLDAGCGEGIVTAWLADALSGATIAGVDVRSDALAQAAIRVPRAELCAADVHGLPYAASSFDLVVCTEVLEHVADPAGALRELARVARRGLVLTVPHEPFFRTGNLARGRHATRLGSTPGHRHAWGRRSFERLVAREATVVGWRSLFPWQAVLARPRA